MYYKKCEHCGKSFKTTQPKAKYCNKYCGGKARRIRQLEKKLKNK